LEIDTSAKITGFRTEILNQDPHEVGKGKGQAIPLQAWTGPEGSTRFRLPDFNTIGTWRC